MVETLLEKIINTKAILFSFIEPYPKTHICFLRQKRQNYTFHRSELPYKPLNFPGHVVLSTQDRK